MLNNNQHKHRLYTALITPFKNGKIDEEALINIVEKQIKAGVDGLVPCGTTGESPNLTTEEHKLVIKLCVETSKKRIPIIAGAGSNSTTHTIELCHSAEKAGADAVMLIVPYYNRPSQEGLYQHFKAVSQAVTSPIILYNHPGRTGVDLKDETLARLAEFDNIIGLKDCSDSMERPVIVRSLIKKKFYQLTGNDPNAGSFNAAGGNGCISTTANIAPDLCVKLQRLWSQGQIDEAIKLQDYLFPLYEALFCETNPIAVKYAASLLGLCSTEIRLPLVAPADTSKTLIKNTLAQLGLLDSNPNTNNGIAA